uniref:UEV domain-containing protein n=1 Tax=Ditylenchus dipsaci TaxID=166011 RepID=A0A915CTG6_9BILA
MFNISSPQGRSDQVVLLTCCTIPVRYKGNTYNIRWLSTFWTTIPTLVLSAMSDQQLPCGFECLHQWTKRTSLSPYLTDWRYPGYETSGLLQMMTMAFQDKCPAIQSPPACKSSA